MVDIVLLIFSVTTETLGKDNTLGRTIMKLVRWAGLGMKNVLVILLMSMEAELRRSNMSLSRVQSATTLKWRFKSLCSASSE